MLQIEVRLYLILFKAKEYFSVLFLFLIIFLFLKLIILLKRNLISREAKAWDIAKNIVVFNNQEDMYLFERIREYALATYNFGNLKNIVKEHNIENILKYRKYFIN